MEVEETGTPSEYLLPNYVIGIGGGPASGKTTLALFLNCIILKSVELFNPDHSYRNPSRGRPPSVAVINQDKYSWPNSHRDNIYSWFTGPKSQQNEEALLSQATFRPLYPDDSKVCQVDEHPVNKDSLPTPEYDRIECFNINSMASRISGWSLDSRSRNPEAELRSLTNDLRGESPADSTDAYKILGKAVKLFTSTLAKVLVINEHKLSSPSVRENVSLDVGSSLPSDESVVSIRRRFTIIEGSSLLARNSGPVAQVQGNPRPPDILQDEVEAQRGLQGIQDRLDVQLFLNVELEEASQRRFSMVSYRDPPRGTRQPGELWKSRGYLEQIAWPLFRQYHAHILKEIPATTEEGDAGTSHPWDLDITVGNVHVKPQSVKTLEETVLWAAKHVAIALATRLLNPPP
ncbi:hypothetical protein F5Y15DRAFT_429731 [Xylariaceae sp. FL0016]|nr:hypothetical protein F5Y15DRAFT_429731 [Xylariaceae sp. FL0016]